MFDGVLYVDGQGYVVAPDSDDLDIGESASGDITIEAWVKFTGDEFAQGWIVEKRGSYGLFTGTVLGQRCLVMVIGYSGASEAKASFCNGPPFTVFGAMDRWTHVVGQYRHRNGILEVLVDGRSRKNEGVGTIVINDTVTPLSVGLEVIGLVDEVRASSAARYISSNGFYSPPTEPLECDDDTRGLWHFDESPDATVFRDNGCGQIQDDLVSQRGAGTLPTPVPVGWWPKVKNPTKSILYSISMLSSDDGWAVGEEGTTLHWDGATWTHVASPTTKVLWSVDMNTANDGWAVGGEGTTLHWDGATWTHVASPTTWFLKSVSVVSSDDVWAVGGLGIFLHWDGATWSRVVTTDTTSSLESVFMVSSIDGWAVGGAGAIYHWDGTTWTDWAGISRRLTRSSLESVTMLSSDNGWIVGWDGTILHWDGRTWSHTRSPSTEDLNSVSMVSPDDGWAAGAAGWILHWDGTTWSSGHFSHGRDLKSVSMVSSYNGWLTDGIDFYHYQAR